MDRQKAERINQELHKNLCQTFQTEAAIDLACDQDRVLREHFPQTAGSHREEILPPDLKEIYEPRHLDQEEDEDDETETARPLSEREKRELFRQHRTLRHPQPTELARSLRHAGARQEAIRFVLEELRSPTCEARPLPLPLRLGMLPRCLRFHQWTNYTAKTVMKEFKISWVKHYAWPKIIVHDQGPEFMGNEFQNPAGAAGVLTRKSGTIVQTSTVGSG